MVIVLSADNYQRLCGAVYGRFDVWARYAVGRPQGPSRREFGRLCRPVLVLALLGECGLRVGEAVQARWGDLSTLPDWSGWLTVLASAAKLGQGRSLPVSVGLGELLRRVRGVVGVRHVAELRHYVLSRSAGDGAVSTRLVQRMVDRLGREELGMSLWPHVLRHTYATRMMRVAELRVVQELLGHRSVRSTQVYTHVCSEDLVEAAGRLPTALGSQVQ